MNDDLSLHTGLMRSCMSLLPIGLTVAFGILLSSCVWRLGVNGKHYTHQPTPEAIDTSALRLDGYYTYLNADSWSPHVMPLLLWQDGTAAMFGSYDGSTFIMSAPTSLPFDRRVDLHRSMAFERNLHDTNGARRSPNFLTWGGFRIDGDSISIQVIRRWGPGGIQHEFWDPWTYHGRILNDTTFVLTRQVVPYFFAGRNSKYVETPRTYRFHPLNPGEKPPSHNWTQFHKKLQ